MEEMIQKFVYAGSGSGYGSGYGDGSGYGSGYGDGSGDGSGDGYGSGSGYGYGDGLFNAVINSQKIYNIDRIPTIIDRVFNNYAKGAIVNGDLSLTPCYIAKHKNIFAHGETLHNAQEALNQKLLQNMSIEERIEAFHEIFKPEISYPIKAFYEWHNTLTGSCEMGRNQFAKEHSIDLEGTMTVEEFILLTENAYGGEIIKMLKPFYSQKKGN